MIDIKRIIENKAQVQEGLLKRMDPKDLDLDGIIKLNDELQEARKAFEAARSEQNSYNDQMAKEEKGSDKFLKLVAQLKDKSTEVKDLEIKAKELEETLKSKVEVLPNIPMDDVVAGGKENNKEVKEFGKKPEFAFDIKDHVDLGNDLEMLDFERASKMAGSGFIMYRDMGARLEWALLNYFITEHIKDGYEMILPPHLLSKESAYAAGQLPKFEDDVYWTQDGSCLIPTAETAIANLYRDETLSEDQLPQKIFAYSPCYRREAGGHGSNERGTMRVHQFNKVEMFQFTTPDKSDKALEELIVKAESLVEKLGLHYKTMKLAAEDASGGAAITYDVEVWLPALNRYIEVSSVSNFTDYQARRGNIKYKPADGGKAQYLHMLNASGLATSRLIVAIMETYQQEDGSILVPDVLQPFMGVDKITKSD